MCNDWKNVLRWRWGHLSARRHDRWTPRPVYKIVVTWTTGKLACSPVYWLLLSLVLFVVIRNVKKCLKFLNFVLRESLFIYLFTVYFGTIIVTNWFLVSLLLLCNVFILVNTSCFGVYGMYTYMYWSYVCIYTVYSSKYVVKYTLLKYVLEMYHVCICMNAFMYWSLWMYVCMYARWINWLTDIFFFTEKEKRNAWKWTIKN